MPPPRPNAARDESLPFYNRTSPAAGPNAHLASVSRSCRQRERLPMRVFWDGSVCGAPSAKMIHACRWLGNTILFTSSKARCRAVLGS